MLYGVDRFEKDWAILVDGDGNAVNVLRSNLPDGVKEGDILNFDGSSYSYNSEETASRRMEAKSQIDELFQ